MIVINIEQEKIEWKPVQTKNGLKHYATLALDFMKEPDERGQTHTVWNNQSQEERAEKAKKNYCGRGKQVSFNAPTAKKEFAVNQQELEPNDENLPF